MWQLNGPAANYLFGCIVFLLAACLLLSFRDTVRALAEFFDIRAIRRLFRNRRAVVLLACFTMALGWLFTCFEDPRDFGLLIAIAGLFLVPGASLAWLVVTDAIELSGSRIPRGRNRGR